MFPLLALCIALLAATPKPIDSLDALRKAAALAKPGDRLVLASGAYSGSLWLEGINGQRGNPIVITAEDPQNPPTINGTAECIHLAGCEWLTVEHLILQKASGNGLNADDRGEPARPARGITLRSLLVRDIGPDGNSDGIKLSGLADFTVEDCTIERWGKGGSGIDMVGCREGRIERCTLTHGDSIGGSGVQMKGGTRDVTVSRSLFRHAGQRAINIGGSTGLAYFRPRPEGFEAKDITIEGCTIIGSDAALAFVGVDGSTVRGNTIYHPRRWAIRILQETREPGFVPSRGGVLTSNLFVFDIPAARNPNIGDATDPASFTFERNAWYCDSNPAASTPTLPSAERDGLYGIDPRLKDPATGDLTPDPDGPAAGIGAGR